MSFKYMIGCDDGYFPPAYKAGRGETVLLCVKTSYREPHLIHGLSYIRVKVDGRETTRSLAELVKLLKGSAVVFLDGITYCGFDTADPVYIYEETMNPVIVLQQYPLDLSRIKNSLKKHFSDWLERYNVIENYYRGFRPYITPWKVVLVGTYGINYEKAEVVLRNSMIYSPVPEPLRIADLLSSQISRIIIRNNV